MEHKYELEISRLAKLWDVDQQEHLSGELLTTLQRSSLLKILDERQAGGGGSLLQVLDVCRSLGRIDASLAWVVGVSNSAWSMQQAFAEEGTAAHDEHKLLAMVLGRPGTLRRDGDGYRLYGEWHYASAWPYARTFFGLAAVEESQGQDVRVVAVPAQMLEISRPWQSAGLRATQSVSVRAFGIPLAAHQLRPYAPILSGGVRTEHMRDTTPGQTTYLGLFSGVLMNCLSGAMLGAAEAALQHVLATASSRPILGSTYAAMTDSAAFRAEIGRLHSLFDSLVCVAERNANVVDSCATTAGENLSDQTRVDVRARATHVMRGCVALVQDLLWLYGSGGLEQGHPLERIWRDINVGARHGGFSRLVPEEAAGLVALGRDPRSLTLMF
ncbi:hypothetical protein J4G66_20035 [Aeromonas dhakensis]|uniref:hypothetical protein n=1 Tax=Aeromonas dhakensis TaxID=196024 RepID=UPI001BCCBE3B|nr:hypothetical protein [Aeromonas dhakensis]MBS4718235.1 hypothetical protein [Aeromonas dhakensis]